MTIHILTLLIVAVIVYPKALVPVGDLVKLLFKGLVKLISGIISLVVRLLEELLKLLGVILTKIFEFLSTFTRWLVSLF